MDEIKNLFRTIFILQNMYLQEPRQQYRQVADQEMPGYGFFFLQIYRPCIQLGFHDPERFLVIRNFTHS